MSAGVGTRGLGGLAGAQSERIVSVGSGRYLLRDLLGRGGASDVYRARDQLLRSDVAVKILRPEATEADRARQRHEVQVLAGLKLSGLVEIQDAGDDGGRPYAVMPLVEGESLADRIRRGPMHLRHVVRLGIRLAEILVYVHQNGVVHRDLTPGIVLLNAAGEPHLTGFGLAVSRRTRPEVADGTVVGTASYMAPEVVRGQAVGPATDIYGLGLVLLECITARQEYPGKPLEAAVARLHRAPAVPFDLPPALRRLIVATTRDEPAERPTTKELVRELRLISGARTIGSLRETGPVRLPRLPTRVKLPASARSSHPPAQHPASNDQIVENGVFISYRRASSWQMARLVYGYLSAAGFDVFMDVEHIDSGDFESKVLTEIGHRRHVVVILQPTTRFEPSDRIDWMRREIARAFELGRNVVPVMSDGFTFSGSRLPTNIERLATTNGVTVYPDYFDEAMNRLHRRFLRTR